MKITNWCTFFLDFFDYDVQLQHLKCMEYDEYPGVVGSFDTVDYYPYPPIFACKFSTAPGYEQVIALANEVGMLALHNTNSISHEGKFPLKGTRVSLRIYIKYKCNFVVAKMT